MALKSGEYPDPAFTNLNGAAAKKLGRTVKLRPDWNEVKLSVMLEVLRHKFNQNPDLADKLLATGDTLLQEGNTWHDYYWGVCNGKGENNLGKLLMLVRQELREAKPKARPVTIAITGHRPDKLFIGSHEPYHYDNYEILVKFFEEVVWQSFKDRGIEISMIYQGMALGVDMAAGRAAVNCGLPVMACIPFKSQPDAWSRNPKIQREYHRLLAECQSSIILNNNPIAKWQATQFLHSRNDYMMEHGEAIVTLYDGSDSGGTANAIHSAKLKGKKIINFYPLWLPYYKGERLI